MIEKLICPSLRSKLKITKSKTKCDFKSIRQSHKREKFDIKKDLHIIVDTIGDYYRTKTVSHNYHPPTL